MMETCGWCGLFKAHKSKTGFAGGWNLLDGKCKYRKATVIGDTCEHWEANKIRITEKDRRMLHLQQREKAKERERKKEIQRIQFFKSFE